jgi:hypothetical protein
MSESRPESGAAADVASTAVPLRIGDMGSRAPPRMLASAALPRVIRHTTPELACTRGCHCGARLSQAAPERDRLDQERGSGLHGASWALRHLPCPPRAGVGSGSAKGPGVVWYEASRVPAVAGPAPGGHGYRFRRSGRLTRKGTETSIQAHARDPHHRQTWALSELHRM